MTAKKKTKIALIVGAIIGILYAILMISICLTEGGAGAQAGSGGQIEYIIMSFVMIPVFMLYAFGYAFGWKRCKGFVAKAARVSADIAFGAIIIQLIAGKGLGRGLMIAMLVFSLAVGLVWIPGVVWGIKAVRREQAQTA